MVLLLQQMVVLSKVTLLMERISKCLISVMAILRLTHCWCGACRVHVISEDRIFWLADHIVKVPVVFSYVRIVSTFLGQVSYWSATPVTNP